VERRFAVHAGPYRQALIVSLLLGAATASAAPKQKQARRLFDKGVAAYTKGDYTAASAALSESYKKEADVETLFAWAQSERKLGRCASAVELYNQLLATDLPDENKKVIEGQLAECKQILGKEGASGLGPRPPAPEPDKKAEPEKQPEPAKPDDKKPEAPPVAQVEAPPPSEPEARGPRPEAHPWWKDPVGDALVVTGAVGLGVGIAMYASAHSADGDKASAMSYSQYKHDVDTAHDHGLYAVIGLTAGAALVAGGIAWYATHQDSGERATVSGLPAEGVRLHVYFAPTGGGVAFSRGF